MFFIFICIIYYTSSIHRAPCFFKGM